MSSQLYFVLLSLSCSIICHRCKYKLNCSIRSMSNSQLFNNHHGSHALFSFISLDSKCIPYVFLLYYPVYSFVLLISINLLFKIKKKKTQFTIYFKILFYTLQDIQCIYFCVLAYQLFDIIFND